MFTMPYTYRSDGHAEGVPYAESPWIDNDFGAMIYVAGKHVLTVGFGVGKDGIYLTQVQLRQKKGNRFLYKLPAHYLDVAVDMLTRAFPDSPLWIVDGQSSVKAIRKAYGKTPCNMTVEDEGRISDLYDRPLADYRRNKRKTQTNEGRKYVALVKKVDKVTTVHEEQAQQKAA